MTKKRIDLTKLNGDDLKDILGINEAVDSLDNIREQYALLSTKIDIAVERLSSSYPYKVADDPSYQTHLDNINTVKAALSSINWNLSYDISSMAKRIMEMPDTFDHEKRPIQERQFIEVRKMLKRHQIHNTFDRDNFQLTTTSGSDQTPVYHIGIDIEGIITVTLDSQWSEYDSMTDSDYDGMETKVPYEVYEFIKFKHEALMEAGA